MRSATLISILFLAACASGSSSPSIAPVSPDAGNSAGSIGGGAPDPGGGADAGTGLPATGEGGSPDGGSAGADAGTGGRADAGTGSPDAGTGSADAGTTGGGLAAHCDPALDPASGVTLTGVSTAASCAGLLPALPTCAAEITACSGWHNSSLGPSGSTTVRGDSDGAGSLALYCANVDVGPSPGFTLYLDGPSGFAKGVHLGDQVWSLPSGMVALTTSYSQRPPPYYDFVNHDGALLGNLAQGASQIYVSPATIEIATPEPATGGVQVFAQQVGADGAPQGPRATVSDFIATTSALWLGGAADDRGGTLIVWSVNGQANSYGRWLDAAGQPATPVFTIPLSSAQMGGAAGLTAGYGVALANSSGRWSWVAAPGSTALTPAPAWLSAHTGAFRLVRGGRALAFAPAFTKAVEVVAPDGTSCGTLALPGNASIGADGTVFATVTDKTFRVYPQLLR